MHRCLHIAEIIQEILVHLAPRKKAPLDLNVACLRWDRPAPFDDIILHSLFDDSVPEPPSDAADQPLSCLCRCWRCEQMDLAVMARTCTLFFEPAMDRLWAVIVGLRPLLSWDHWDTSMLNQYPVPCLSTNTGRIKHLVLGESGCHDGGRSQYRALEALSSSSLPTICPRLQTLEVRTRVEYVDTCLLFLGPQLSHLVVHCQNRDIAFRTVSAAIERCPRLQSVDIKLAIRKMALTTKTVAHWSKVRSFSCVGALSKVDSETIPVLARLPALVELEIRPPRTEVSSQLRSATDFPSLTRLSLPWGTGTRIATFLHYIPSHSLQELKVNMFLARTNEVLVPISRFSNLRVLRLEKMLKRSDMEEFDFGPLLTLRHLRAVAFHFAGVYGIFTNGFIATLGQSWPELADFSIQFVHQGIPLLSPTITCLPHFARTFPKLENLRVPLNATNVATAPIPDARCDRPLELDLQDGYITEDVWPLVATYISAVYPNASLVPQEAHLRKMSC